MSARLHADPTDSLVDADPSSTTPKKAVAKRPPPKASPKPSPSPAPTTEKAAEKPAETSNLPVRPVGPVGKPLDIAFSLDGVLVTQIPAVVAKMLPAAQVINAGGLYFRINDDAQKLIAKILSDSSTKVSIFSSRPKAETDAILSIFMINGSPLSAVVNKVLSKEDMKVKDEKAPEPHFPDEPVSLKYEKDLSKVNENTAQVILVDSDDKVVSDKNKDHFLNAGKNIYFFTDFDSSKKELEKKKTEEADLKKKLGDKFDPKRSHTDAENYPSSQEELTESQQRADRVYSIIKQAKKEYDDGKPIDKALKDGEGAAPLWSSKSAIETAAADLAKHPTWKLDPDGKKVVGCVEKSDLDKNYEEKLDFSFCLRGAPTHYEWRGDKKDTCARLTADGIFLSNEEKSVCLKELPPEHAYWTDEKQDKCGSFTSDNELLGEIPLRNCEGLRIFCNQTTHVLESTQKILIDGTLQHLIPEIMALKDNEIVPASVYKKYSSKLIGASIVARKHDSDESAANVADPVYDFRKDSKIQMAFNEAYIESIAKGCFLNQHQAGHTNGTNNHNMRANAEDIIAGVKLEAAYVDDPNSPADKVRPKYAGFGLTKKEPGFNDNLSSISGYGNVVAVFKDSIKDRTTFSAEDSLGYSAQTFTLDLREKGMNLQGQNSGSYWEAQIWGELCMSDVDHFIVNCLGGVSEAAIAQLKELKIPVYQCAGLAPGGAFQEGALR